MHILGAHLFFQLVNEQYALLITFEGIDGSGKSTQARMLEEHLRGEGRSVRLVREPGGPPLAERIRSLLLSHDVEISPFAELLLFSAARAQLVRETIQPALKAGVVVICDRFYDSTTAYQGAGRGLADPAWLHDFHQHVTEGLMPDRTYLIDVSVAVASGRRSGRNEDEADRMESGGDDFFERVRAAYLHLAEREPTRVLVLDGTLPVDTLHKQIVEDLERLMLGEGGMGREGEET